MSDDGFDSYSADPDFSMQSAILYGMDQPMENVFQQGGFNCPTGNCTWPRFESLAVCNMCTNVTARLESIVASFWAPDSGTAFILPNGLYLYNANGWEYGSSGEIVLDDGALTTAGYLMTALGTDNASETITAHDLDTLIISIPMVRVWPGPLATTVTWPDLPLSAMECALFYCVNSYEFKVSNGTLLVESDQIKDAKRAANSWVAEGNQHHLNKSTPESIAFSKANSEFPRTDLMLVSPNGSRFNISQPAINSISYYYQSTFAVTGGAGPYHFSNSKTGWLSGFYSNNSHIPYEPGVMQPLFASQDLNGTFTTLAASMSNAIRAGADETFDGVPQVVMGTKGELKTFYRVVWPWISLHCFIVAAGVVFLLVTIQENKRHGRAVPMWRSSNLAVLNRGQEVAGILSGMQTIKQMEAISKASQVILFEKGAEGPSLEHLDFDPLEVQS